MGSQGHFFLRGMCGSLPSFCPTAFASVRLTVRGLPSRHYSLFMAFFPLSLSFSLSLRPSPIVCSFLTHFCNEDSQRQASLTMIYILLVSCRSFAESSTQISVRASP